MKKIYLTGLALMAACAATFAQSFHFPVEITTDWNAESVIYPASPLKYQRLFVGGMDLVQTTETYGNAAGETLAKEQNDFIGFTAATEAEIAEKAAAGISNFLGWVSVNHEDTQANDMSGDGGGMTVFAVRRGNNGLLEVIEQELPDGRKGKFFNVDFANTVGETGMNCGGIQSEIDGRIWTAEEWFRTANNVGAFRFNNQENFTVNAPEFEGTDYDGQVIENFQSLNWLVEIDPRTAKAIRKQYNWGRGGWEGGAIANDNRTVYLGEDDTPGRFVKFVADEPGDFTKGKTYVYNHLAPGHWVEIDNSKLENMMNLKQITIEAGMTMFNRLEWVKINKYTGKVYIAETGRDNLTGSFLNPYVASKGKSTIAPHFAKAYRERYKVLNGVDFTGSDAAALDSVMQGKFNDYYGRVLEYDPETGEIRTLIEGGPYLANTEEATAAAVYPQKHVTNPDGLGMYYLNDKAYLLINEDPNGRSFGRMAWENRGSGREIAECYMLDLDIVNPTIDDLKKITHGTIGAEIYGVAVTPDGKTIFVNNQHPNKNLISGVYSHALTYAITGWDEVINDGTVTSIDNAFNVSGLSMYPNPASREISFNRPVDIAIYDIEGKRMKVARNTTWVSVHDLTPGIYYVRTVEGETMKLVVK